jgi:NAD(P)-dependent dehydrogenase (short-subunit alcohol dehydrogenase family)
MFRKWQRGLVMVRGKVVFVTDAAHPVGLALVREALSVGAKVVMIDEDEELLSGALKSLRSYKDRIFARAGSLMDEGFIRSVLYNATDKFGPPDVFILIPGAHVGRRRDSKAKEAEILGRMTGGILVMAQTVSQFLAEVATYEQERDRKKPKLRSVLNLFDVSPLRGIPDLVRALRGQVEALTAQRSRELEDFRVLVNSAFIGEASDEELPKPTAVAHAAFCWTAGNITLLTGKFYSLDTNVE